MLVAFLYLSFLVTEGAYPATHWAVNSEGKIQAQASSVNKQVCLYFTMKSDDFTVIYKRSFYKYVVFLYFECNGVYNL